MVSQIGAHLAGTTGLPLPVRMVVDAAGLAVTMALPYLFVVGGTRAGAAVAAALGGAA